MIVEVVAVGTELLLGQIVNGNAAHIGRVLAEQGFDANHQQVVGDNLGRMTETIRTAMERSGAVIITGGIGPTQDDITREAICAATGLTMEHSEAYAQALRDRWERSGRVMPASNLRQADHPAGAELLPNPRGSAPGLALLHEDTWVFALPGVPPEMHLLLADHVMPRLRDAAGIDEVLVSRLLRTWGRSESQVSDLLDDLYESSSNPSLAFLASDGEIKVRLTAKAETVAVAEELIAPMESEVRRLLGPAVFGADGDEIESVILRMLLARDWSVATAESVTGGRVVERLTAAPGASAVVKGGVAAYASEVKRDVLGVDISGGVVNEPVAIAMAEGVRRILGTNVAVATTGSGGPEPLEAPVGTVVIAVSTPEGSRARTLSFPGDRERIRAYGSTAALHLLRLGIGGTWWGS